MTDPSPKSLKLARELFIPFDRDCDLESENRCYNNVAALIDRVRAEAVASVIPAVRANINAINNPIVWAAEMEVQRDEARAALTLATDTMISIDERANRLLSERDGALTEAREYQERLQRAIEGSKVILARAERAENAVLRMNYSLSKYLLPDDNELENDLVVEIRAREVQ